MLEKLASNEWNIFTAAHLLNRAGFGGTPETIAAVFRLGPEKAVERLLNPGDAPKVPADASFGTPTNLLAMRQEARTMMDEQGLSEQEARQRARQKSQRESRSALEDLAEWWLDLMVGNQTPLREKMVLFWHGHFASSMQKVRDANLMYRQNALFRTHAVGNFGELAKGVTKDPAMMVYLDVQTSRAEMPNENFAREVMELFTLGEGHYSEEDIKEAARAFTGYRLNRRDRTFELRPRDQDSGVKKVFGREVKNGDQVVEAILTKPECAEFITRKIWRFFVSDIAPEPQIRALAATLRQSGYELAPMLRQLFLSREFYANEVIRKQIKSPVQWMVNNAIILDVDLPPSRVIRTATQSLGQELFFPPNVKGWDGGKAWINSSTLLQRYNLAALFVGLSLVTPAGGAASGPSRGGNAEARLSRAGRMHPDLEAIVPGEEREQLTSMLQNLAFRLFQAPLLPRQAEAFATYWYNSEGKPSDDRVRGLIHLMMSTPDFQLC